LPLFNRTNPTFKKPPSSEGTVASSVPEQTGG